MKKYLHGIKVDNCGLYIIRKMGNHYQICFCNSDILYSIYKYKYLGTASNKLKDILESFSNTYNKECYYCEKDKVQDLYIKMING